MALKATIYKAQLQIADMDRHVYGDHNLVIARHPSETDERMMIRVLAFALHTPADDLAGFLDKSFSVETIQTKLAEPGAAWWVADRDGEILGFANTGPNTLPHPDARPSHAELRRLYIGRDAQGLGLGTQLLKLALEWMETNTDGPMWIGVWSGNEKAQKLYAAYGFEKAGEYDYPVGAWNDHEFILRRG